MPLYEDIDVITSDNVKLHFWLIKHPNRPKQQQQHQQDSIPSPPLRRRNPAGQNTVNPNEQVHPKPQSDERDERDSEQEQEEEEEEEEAEDQEEVNKNEQQSNNGLPTILFFHGNAGNIAHRLPQANIMYKRVPANLALVSYRGYGLSEGEPSEEGLKKDAQAVLDYLWQRPDLDKSRFICFGSSIGGGVALSLSHSNQDKIKGVIVENTFTHLEDMLTVLYPFLSPFKFLLKNKWPNRDLVPDLKMGILFLSGRKDELVPPTMMDSLFELATKSTIKKFVRFTNGTHNDTWFVDTKAYGQHIASFINSLK